MEATPVAMATAPLRIRRNGGEEVEILGCYGITRGDLPPYMDYRPPRTAGQRTMGAMFQVDVKGTGLHIHRIRILSPASDEAVGNYVRSQDLHYIQVQSKQRVEVRRPGQLQPATSRR
eukprot:GHVU01076651.1.p1 GENE.GHVU01076651.1~~GHVU01076651.1.p1  ORF type:complete len:118 (-),score=4.13 GHVU01076651.1:233-586(-)